MNFQMFKLVLEKAEESKIKLPTSIRSLRKAREFQKNIYFCFIDYSKTFDCVDHHKLWKILKEMEIPDYLTCLLRNLCASQGATVRIRHGKMNWFKIGKGVCQSCIYNGYNLSKLWEDRGAWHAAVHGVTKSWTRLSD